MFKRMGVQTRWRYPRQSVRQLYHIYVDIALGARVPPPTSLPFFSFLFFLSSFLFSSFSPHEAEKREEKHTRTPSDGFAAPPGAKSSSLIVGVSFVLLSYRYTDIYMEGAAGVVAGHWTRRCPIDRPRYLHTCMHHRRALCLRPFRCRRSAALRTYVDASTWRLHTYVLVCVRKNLSVPSSRLRTAVDDEAHYLSIMAHSSRRGGGGVWTDPIPAVSLSHRPADGLPALILD